LNEWQRKGCKVVTLSGTTDASVEALKYQEVGMCVCERESVCVCVYGVCTLSGTTDASVEALKYQEVGMCVCVRVCVCVCVWCVYSFWNY